MKGLTSIVFEQCQFRAESLPSVPLTIGYWSLTIRCQIIKGTAMLENLCLEFHAAQLWLFMYLCLSERYQHEGLPSSSNSKSQEIGAVSWHDLNLFFWYSKQKPNARCSVLGTANEKLMEQSLELCFTCEEDGGWMRITWPPNRIMRLSGDQTSRIAQS